MKGLDLGFRTKLRKDPIEGGGCFMGYFLRTYLEYRNEYVSKS